MASPLQPSRPQEIGRGASDTASATAASASPPARAGQLPDITNSVDSINRDSNADLIGANMSHVHLNSISGSTDENVPSEVNDRNENTNANAADSSKKKKKRSHNRRRRSNLASSNSTVLDPSNPQLGTGNSSSHHNHGHSHSASEPYDLLSEHRREPPGITEFSLAHDLDEFEVAEAQSTNPVAELVKIKVNRHIKFKDDGDVVDAGSEGSDDARDANINDSHEYSDVRSVTPEEISSFEPEEICQHTYNTLPANVKKYWKQRYCLFTKFDEGVFMNTELWFSVTPESVAAFTANFIKCCSPNSKVALDLCSGGGGDSIQLARVFDRCVSVEINKTNIYCAHNNAKTYGVANKINFIHADWLQLSADHANLRKMASKYKIDIAFSSPPWGGPNYVAYRTFDLRHLRPLPLKELLMTLFAITDKVVLFLPRNSDIHQLHEVTAELLGPEGNCRVIFAKLDGRIKGLLCFWGNDFMSEEMLNRNKERN